MAWTKVKIAGGVLVAGLLAFQWHEIIAQKQELGTVRQELKEREKALETQKAEMENLRQERLAMAKDLRSATTEKAKAIGKEKAAVAAAKSAAVAAAGKETSPMEMAKLLDDPALNDLLRVQIRGVLKGQLGGFAKKANLSEEEMDKLYSLMVENSIKNRASAAAVIRGELDVNQALSNRDEGKKELENDLRSLLGDEKYEQFGEFKKDAIANRALDSLKGASGDHPLSEDQRNQFLKVMHNMPEIPTLDNIDLFRSKESMDEVYQKLENIARQVREQSAGFLSPEQMAALEKVHGDVIQNVKSQMALGQKALVK